jgi:hypothetical protein
MPVPQGGASRESVQFGNRGKNETVSSLADADEIDADFSSIRRFTTAVNRTPDVKKIYTGE